MNGNVFLFSPTFQFSFLPSFSGQHVRFAVGSMKFHNEDNYAKKLLTMLAASKNKMFSKN